jgi:hypothetical protein
MTDKNAVEHRLHQPGTQRRAAGPNTHAGKGQHNHADMARDEIASEPPH